MTDPIPARQLLDSLNDALELLSEFDRHPPMLDDRIEPLPNLIEQCVDLVSRAPTLEPIRVVHSLACTGGTLICKLLATLPNTMLLSEIDPLSRVQIGDARNPRFAPTDLIYGARVAARSLDDAGAIRVFSAGLRALHVYTRETGLHLVLRDHNHSHFHSTTAFDTRPTLRTIVQALAPVRSVVTVRHPLDSLLSLDNNGWRQFAPFTLSEYARRYLAFLDRHRGINVVRYEDLVEDPDGVLREICIQLELPYTAEAKLLLPEMVMSGDSGRSSSKIGKRARRAVPDWLATELPGCAPYEELCVFLGYDPAV